MSRKGQNKSSNLLQFAVDMAQICFQSINQIGHSGIINRGIKAVRLFTHPVFEFGMGRTTPVFFTRKFFQAPRVSPTSLESLS